jgi:hypothetical protein
MSDRVSNMSVRGLVVHSWYIGFVALLLTVTCGICTLHRPSEEHGGSHRAETRRGTLVSANIPPAELQCDTAIETVTNVPAGYTVFRDIVALGGSRNAPTALQTRTNADADSGARLFAKSGLLVRTGVAVKLVVPDAWRNMMSISWGNGATRTWELTVPGCGGAAGWNVFAGGFWVEDVGCMELILRDGDHEEVIQVGVGAPCRGQNAPPAPSDL